MQWLVASERHRSTANAVTALVRGFSGLRRFWIETEYVPAGPRAEMSCRAPSRSRIGPDLHADAVEAERRQRKQPRQVRRLREEPDRLACRARVRENRLGRRPKGAPPVIVHPRAGNRRRRLGAPQRHFVERSERVRRAEDVETAAGAGRQEQPASERRAEPVEELVVHERADAQNHQITSGVLDNGPVVGDRRLRSRFDHHVGRLEEVVERLGDELGRRRAPAEYPCQPGVGHHAAPEPIGDGAADGAEPDQPDREPTRARSRRHWPSPSMRPPVAR